MLIACIIPFILCLNHTATTAIFTLSLHDALPISHDQLCPWRHLHVRSVHRILCRYRASPRRPLQSVPAAQPGGHSGGDRKSTRLNSSHTVISYAVFCLKKKNQLFTPRDKGEKEAQ